MKKVLSIIVTFVLMISLIGCGSKANSESSSNDNKEGYAKELYLYNWTEYIPQSVFDAFEKEYGIKVVQSTFSSNEELLAKLLAGGTDQYDLTVASNYIIQPMIEQGLIQKIDKSEIPNISNVSDDMLNRDFDKGNEYSVPYMSSCTVVAVNKAKLKELGVEINSLNDLQNSKLANQIVVVDDVREVVGAALKAQGKDPNTKDEETIKGTEPWLDKLKGNVKSYDSDSPKSLLISNEAAVGLVYNMDAGLAMAENKDIDVVKTKEPDELSIDNFVITSGAKHKKEAELFINFIERPDIYKMCLDEYPGGCINKEAYKSLDDDYLNNKGSNVDQEEIKRANLIDDVGDAAEYYDDVFTKMKAGAAQ